MTFFHLGKFFKKAVDIYVVENDAAREIIYDPSYFDMPENSPARSLPKGAGFAGFRFQEAKDSPKFDWHHNDWVAFLGASYFRAIGDLHQYGLSARGVALDTAVADRDEEFPDLTQIYIGPQSGDTVTVYALLEGPKIVGAGKISDDARRRRDHGHRPVVLLARRHRAFRHRAADLHVLVFRNRQGDGNGLAAGSP